MKYDIILIILGQTKAGWKYSCKQLEHLQFYSAAGLRERLRIFSELDKTHESYHLEGYFWENAWRQS